MWKKTITVYCDFNPDEAGVPLDELVFIGCGGEVEDAPTGDGLMLTTDAPAEECDEAEAIKHGWVSPAPLETKR